jgi:hypothetical protein
MKITEATLSALKNKKAHFAQTNVSSCSLFHRGVLLRAVFMFSPVARVFCSYFIHVSSFSLYNQNRFRTLLFVSNLCIVCYTIKALLFGNRPRFLLQVEIYSWSYSESAGTVSIYVSENTCCLWVVTRSDLFKN